MTQNGNGSSTPGPLDGIRVLDLGTVYAAPIAAMLLGDYGAEVIKVEHPRGDPARTHGHSKDGHGLWWKVISRNKRAVTLNLGRPEGRALLEDLVGASDVLIENFRPGVMEKWGIGPDRLHELNPGLVMLRVTGFGQFGPYAQRRAFGTLAEAMSGFAHQTGQPDGPPTLPPFGLADGVTGLAGLVADQHPTNDRVTQRLLRRAVEVDLDLNAGLDRTDASSRFGQLASGEFGAVARRVACSRGPAARCPPISRCWRHCRGRGEACRARACRAARVSTRTRGRSRGGGVCA